MSVVFEIYMFTPEYSEQIKKREAKAKKNMENDFIPEQGAVICMNTHREVGLPFFNIEELLNLVDSGFKLSHEQGHTEPIRELGEREIPPLLATRGVLTLEDDFKGSMNWEEGKAVAVDSREDLERTFNETAMIAETYLGGDDSRKN